MRGPGLQPSPPACDAPEWLLQQGLHDGQYSVFTVFVDGSHPRLGFALYWAFHDPVIGYIASVREEGPARDFGLMPGDEIICLNHVGMTGISQLHAARGLLHVRPLEITLRRRRVQSEESSRHHERLPLRQPVSITSVIHYGS